MSQNLILNTIGKDSLETQIVNSINTEHSFKNYILLEKALDSIVLKLQKKGFIQSELLSFTKENDSIYEAKFNLNDKIDTIYIYNRYPDNLMLDKNKGKENSIYKVEISNLESTLKKINKTLAEDGDPFATLQLVNIRKRDEFSIEADLEIVKTQNRKIDNILIKGYEKFPRSYLNRFLKIKKESTLNLNSIKEKVKEVNSLRFAKTVRDPEILFTEDSTSLYIYLEKQPVNSFDGFLGFGTTEDNSKIKFNGYLNLNLINNLNFGESLRFVYKSDENDQRTVDVKLNLPYLLKTPIGLELNLNIFRKDSTFNTTIQAYNIFYQTSRKTKLYVGYEATNSSDLRENILNSDVYDFKSNFYSVAFEFQDLTDDLMFPVENYLLIHGGIGKREFTDQEEKQTNVHFRAYNIFNLNEKNSIYLNAQSQVLFSDEYLTNELYRFGGINSLRGFEENSIFASLYALVNTEYRYRLNQSIYINSIVDAAYYENKVASIKEKLFGFGLGLGILTKAGLLKLNYANGLKENQSFNFKNTKIHISLTATF